MANSNPRGTNVSHTPVIVGSGGYVLEKLEGVKNYNNWKFMMKMSLIIDNLWNCILGTDDDSNRGQRALAKICLNVQPLCHAHVREATTAKEAWEKLQAAFEDKGLCRRLTLLRNLLRIKYEDFNSMGDYISGLISLVQQLADIDHKVNDEEVAMLMLGGLPVEFDPLVMGLEATHDKLSSDAVKARLLSEDYRKGVAGTSNNDVAALALKKVDRFIRPKKEIICYKCGKAGHIKPKCPQIKTEKRTKPGKKAEDKLLLAASFVAGNFDKDSWFVDSGCTTHMSMRKDWYSEYTGNVSKEIVIANNQKLYGKGSGEITINLKNNVKRTITDVMYVPEAAVNLLSVSKMTDKGLIVVFDDRKCRIYNKSECRIQGEYKVSASKIDGVYGLDQQNMTLAKTYEWP